MIDQSEVLVRPVSVTPDGQYEQVVMAELLVPDVPNVYGDIYTREAIKEFVYAYAMQPHGLDVEHDNVDVKNTQLVVVESFIARPGDPDFIEGSWVIGMKILDPDLWQKVLAGELNGYSFQAICQMEPVVIQNLRDRQVVGVTEPHWEDGHVHDYLIVTDSFNRPIAGGTGVTNGHSHTISTHTITDVADDHLHRYQVVLPEPESDDQTD
jgi:hypothetical protein